MQAAQDGEGDDLATCMLCRHGSGFLLRNLLSDPLMRSCLVKVGDIRIEDVLELLLMQDEQMVEALTPDTPQEAFTDGIGTWTVIRDCEHLNVTRLRNPREGHPKLGIIILDEILWPHTKGSGFPKRYVPSTRRWESVSRRRGSPFVTSAR